MITRHPVRGAAWGFLFGIGVALFLIGQATIALGTAIPVVIAVAAAGAGAAAGWFLPPRPVGPPPGEVVAAGGGGVALATAGSVSAGSGKVVAGFCRRCGGARNPGAVFCGQCGTPFDRGDGAT